jgi:hypothetical protein
VAGLNVHRGRLDGGSYDQRLRKLKSVDAVLMVDAGRRGVIHLKGRGGWLSQAPQEEVQFLLPRLALHPAIDLTASRDGPGRIKVISKKGLAVIQRSVEGSVALYELTLKRGDPFGYTKTADMKRFIEGRWHDSRSWLAATADSSYPDFVPQIVEMFDSDRAGDIVLFAADGWGFDAESKSSHGSCLREDMSVPMFFAGPGLPAGGRIDCARLVDVMPTILDLLGQSHRLARVEPIDGVSIAAVLKGAKRPDEREHDTFSDKSDVLSNFAHQSAAVRDRRMEPVESD